MLKTLLLVIVLAGICSSQNVMRITTKTADIDGADMTLATVDVEMMNKEFLLCFIDDLDNLFSNDFKQGAIDTFEGRSLQECNNIPLVDNELPYLRITHNLFDQWIMEYMIIELDNGKAFFCPDGEPIDNFEYHDLADNCTLIEPEPAETTEGTPATDPPIIPIF